jgi:ABC-type multidrug transport system permease subunit
LIFASAAFVPIATMPNWLQHFADNQPITFAVTAARHFALGIPMDGALWKLLIWVFGILLLFIPLAVRAYRKRA